MATQILALNTKWPILKVANWHKIPSFSGSFLHQLFIIFQPLLCNILSKLVVEKSNNKMYHFFY